MSPASHRLSVSSSARARPYVVHVGGGLLTELGVLLRDAGLQGRVSLVSDEIVLKRHGETAVRSLSSAGFLVESQAVPAGEASKSFAQAETLYSFLVRGGHTRTDAMVALGGGVVGDLAGFVAATYHRGVPLVQVPTTLLAQVDSAIGGKVAVDHPLGKNLVGAFHPPLLVAADTATLQTLPRRERWSGLAEVAKAALIGDLTLLAQLERHLEALGEGTAAEETLLEAVARAARLKVEVVSEDEHETGRRLHLNFGHTLGHALEAAAGFGPLTHGEAVVAGMVAAVELSRRRNRLSLADAQRAQALLSRFPRPPPLTALEPAEINAALFRDKKVIGSKLRYVVLDGLGHAGLDADMPLDLLESGIALALAWVEGRT